MLRLKTKQCFRHTNIIVEVALRVQHIVFLFQNRRHEFLCCCFTVRACNADDFSSEVTPMVIGKTLQCLQTIIRKYKSFIALRSILLFVNDGIRTSLLYCLCRESISIEGSTFESKEDRALRTIPAISCHHRMLLKDFIKF